MNCTSCGRPLAQGARTCVYCQQGRATKSRPNPANSGGSEGSTHRRLFMSSWLKFLLFAGIVGGAAYMAYRHVPEIKAWVDQALSGIL